jgi:toxin-antitoxin system PIN domain toxin
VIALDSNILIYAHRQDASFHVAASTVVRNLAEGRSAWAIPWTCLHEFLAIVTHPRVFARPSQLNEAVDQVQAWLEAPNLAIIGESSDYWDRFKAVITSGRVTGPMIHDARIAAVCLEHGIHELWTADRDFGRFPALRVRNPLI